MEWGTTLHWLRYQQSVGVRMPKPKSKLRNRTLTDMKAYQRSLDMAELWEEFYLKLSPSGKPLYANIGQFVRKKTKTHSQFQFLMWYLGPRDVNNELNAKFQHIGEPLDWMEKRRTGGWYDKNAVKALIQPIRQTMEGLQALRAVGDGFVLPFIVRIKKLTEKLDMQFQEGEYLDSLTAQQNEARSNTYIGFVKQLMGMMDDAVTMYGKSLGINFDKIESYAQLIANVGIVASSHGTDERYQQVLQDIVSMTMMKSTMYNQPLPEGMGEKVVEITARPVDDKSKVQ
jgi:hypothetical protein